MACSTSSKSKGAKKAKMAFPPPVKPAKGAKDASASAKGKKAMPPEMMGKDKNKGKGKMLPGIMPKGNAMKKAKTKM